MTRCLFDRYKVRSSPALCDMMSPFNGRWILPSICRSTGRATYSYVSSFVNLGERKKMEFPDAILY